MVGDSAGGVEESGSENVRSSSMPSSSPFQNTIPSQEEAEDSAGSAEESGSESAPSSRKSKKGRSKYHSTRKRKAPVLSGLAADAATTLSAPPTSQSSNDAEETVKPSAKKISTKGELDHVTDILSKLTVGENAQSKNANEPIDLNDLCKASSTDLETLLLFFKQGSYVVDGLKKQEHHHDLSSDRETNRKTLEQTNIFWIPHILACKLGYFEKDDGKDDPLIHISTLYGSYFGKLRPLVGAKGDDYGIRGFWGFTDNGRGHEGLPDDIKTKRMPVRKYEVFQQHDGPNTQLPTNAIFTIGCDLKKNTTIDTHMVTIPWETPMCAGAGKMLDESLAVLCNKMEEEVNELRKAIRSTDMSDEEKYNLRSESLHDGSPGPFRDTSK